MQLRAATGWLGFVNGSWKHESKIWVKSNIASLLMRRVLFPPFPVGKDFLQICYDLSSRVG